MLRRLIYFTAIFCLMQTSAQNEVMAIQRGKPWTALSDAALHERTKNLLKISIKNELIYKNTTRPSYTATIFLYSKLGFYLSINDSGNITGTLDTKSNDSKFY